MESSFQGKWNSNSLLLLKSCIYSVRNENIRLLAQSFFSGWNTDIDIPLLFGKYQILYSKPSYCKAKPTMYCTKMKNYWTIKATYWKQILFIQKYGLEYKPHTKLISKSDAVWLGIWNFFGKETGSFYFVRKYKTFA